MERTTDSDSRMRILSHTSNISIGFLKSFLSTWWVDVRPLACSNHLPLSRRYVIDADLIRQRMVHLHPARAPAGVALRGRRHNVTCPSQWEWP